MNPSRFFWGTLLILFGAYFLLMNFDLIKFDLSFILDLWPLLLVLWGISLLKIHPIIKNILAGISAVLFVLIIIAFFSKLWHWDWNYSTEENKRSRTVQSEHHKLLMDTSYKFVEFSLNGGAGEFCIDDTTSELVDILTEGAVSSLNFNRADSISNNTIVFNFDDKNNFFKNIHSNRNADLKFNTSPVWKFDFNLGASEFNADLAYLKTREVNIKAGAADVFLKLGNHFNETYLNIDAGASDINIEIPSGSGCRIESKTGLSGENFDGFVSKGNNIYESDNYNNAKDKIFINISGGISDFNVTKYNIQ